MNKYPVSLKKHCDYIEKVNHNLRETIAYQEKHIKTYRETVHRLQELIEKNEATRGVWIFQNDGYDCIHSMCADLQVLIKAEDLREMMAKGETLAEDIAI